MFWNLIMFLTKENVCNHQPWCLYVLSVSSAEKFLFSVGNTCVLRIMEGSKYWDFHKGTVR